MTMDTGTIAYQPHPLDDPDAHRWYVGAELVTVAGHSAGLIAVLAAFAEVWPEVFALVGFGVFLCASVAGNTLRLRAWERTAGALGRRRWAAARNPARLVRPVGDALVIGAAGAWVLDVRPGEGTEIVVVAVAAYLIGRAVGSTTARGSLDLPVLATRLSTPLVLVVLSIAGLAPENRLGVLGLSAIFGAVVGLVAHVGVALRRRA